MEVTIIRIINTIVKTNNTTNNKYYKTIHIITKSSFSSLL